MTGWPLVSLSELLTQFQDYVTELEDRPYKRLSVKLYGRGVELDRPSDGLSVKMEKHQLARSGQVIVSEIWAKKGAIGIVPEQGEGALVTSHFFLFDIASERLTPGWMRWLLRSNYFESRFSSDAKGTTSYASVRPRHFLAAYVPLPPPDVQRRIVAQLDATMAKAQKVKERIESIDAEIRHAARAIVWDSARNGGDRRRCRDFLRRRACDILVEPDIKYTFAGVFSFGRGVFRSLTKLGSEFSYTVLTRLREGDFVYPKLMAWEGALGIVPPECDGLFVSPEFPVFEVDQSIVLPVVLDVFFRDPRVLPILQSGSTGTNLRRKRLNPEQFLEIEVPVPCPRDQATLMSLCHLGKQISDKHQQTLKDLESLIPSLLDRAFSEDGSQLRAVRSSIS